MRPLSLLFTLLLSLCVLTLNAKETKRPQSYALTRAQEALEQEQYADALQWFEREVSDNPDNGYAYTYIASIYYQHDEAGQALSAVNKAIRLVPKKDTEWRSGDLVLRARVHLELRDTVSALDDYAQALKLHPNRNALKDRAELYYGQDKYDLSDADFREMIKLDPADGMGYMGIGRNAMEQERWDEAIAQFDKVTRLSPDYSRAYSFRGQCYLGKENWARATDDIVKALDIDGDDKALYLLRNIPDAAEPMLKSKLIVMAAKQPTNRYWPYCIGTLLYEKKRYEEALPYYDEANRIEAHPQLEQQMAKCYYNLGAYPLALEHINLADSMSPDDEDTLDIKADILDAMEDLDGALAERNRCISINPESGFGYTSRAMTHMKRGDYARAADDYSTALMVAPILEIFLTPLKNRGDAYRLAGKTGLAVADYNRVIEEGAENPDLFGDTLAGAYSGIGEHDKAIATMTEYLHTDSPENLPGNYYDLACIYARAGRNAEAVKALRDARSAGYRNYGHMRTDYDLFPLHDDPDFQRLVREMEQEAMSKYGAADGAETADADAVYETVEVPFTKDSGVTKVKCTINGLPLHFVFDTGAADVTMSLVEANFMLKNDYIKPTDIVGTTSYVDANGDISEGTVINLREVDFGGLRLDNVRASVVRNQRAPLLLGQSVLGRLGRIEIDNAAQLLRITHRTR